MLSNRETLENSLYPGQIPIKGIVSVCNDERWFITGPGLDEEIQ